MRVAVGVVGRRPFRRTGVGLAKVVTALGLVFALVPMLALVLMLAPVRDAMRQRFARLGEGGCGHEEGRKEAIGDRGAHWIGNLAAGCASTRRKAGRVSARDCPHRTARSSLDPGARE